LSCPCTSIITDVDARGPAPLQSSRTPHFKVSNTRFTHSSVFARGLTMPVSEPTALGGVAGEEMVTVPLAGSQSEVKRGEDFSTRTLSSTPPQAREDPN
jgi:hypothetical protein